MGTDDEAEDTEDETEETDCETEEVSGEERATKKKKERKENQQRKDGKENFTPQETAAQRIALMPEEQMSKAVTPISELRSNNESIDESTNLGQTKSKSSRKRKANEIDDGEEQIARTTVAKKANMNRRRQPVLTDAERKERRRIANKRSRESANRRKALARKQMEERTSET